MNAEAASLPGYVQLEPVGQCNLRCTMCPVQFRDDAPADGRPAFMPFESFIKLLDQLADAEELHLQGLGEPMMHPRFFDMIEYAVGRGLRVTTNSNLTLLSSRRAERCVSSGLHCLHISVDSSNPETYAKIRVGGALERVGRNIERLADCKRRSGSSFPKLKLVCVVMRQNLNDLPALLRSSAAWGVNEVFVQHLCHDFGEDTLPRNYRPMRGFVERETLENAEPEVVARAFQIARKEAQRLGINLRLPNVRWRHHPAGTPGRERCAWPWSGAYISYQGHMMPCCMIATPDRMTLGNAFSEGFAATWNGQDYREFRAALSTDEPPPVCRSCSIYNGTF